MKAGSRRQPLWLHSMLPELFTVSVVWVPVACSLVVGQLPANSEPFLPPAVYVRWWKMTEACSGRTGDFSAMHWYRVPGTRFMRSGHEVSGYANRFVNRIVLAKETTEQGAVVRHEMLHILLRTDGHPHAQFLGSCAALVYCQEACVTDAGPTHTPRRYAVLPPESLEVASHAELLSREPDGQRWVSLTVSARNPRAITVVTATPRTESPPTFGFDLRTIPGPAVEGGEIATDSSALIFQPMETKRRLFEFKVVSDSAPPFTSGTVLSSRIYNGQILSGTYLIRGEYARRRTVGDTLVVRP